MYEFEVNFGGNRIRMWTGVPNGMKYSWTWESHNHADFELHVLLDGSVDLDVEGKTYSLHKNQAIVVAPGRYHCRLKEDASLMRFDLNFSVSDGPLLRAMREQYPDCGVCTVDEEVLDACRCIDGELTGGNLFHRVMVQGHLIRLMVGVFRSLQVDCTPEKPPEVRSTELHIHEVDLFFESHLKNGAKIDDLAAKLYLSRGQLSRLLRDNYGMTFREKLLRARMSQAANLLRHTDMPIYRVADEVGYTASSSFYHVFRDWYGMTPEQYRAENRSKEV